MAYKPSPSGTDGVAETTRDRLVRAMIEVVGSDGLAAASVRTIARRAGCNEAVLYQHFPSKLAMQQAIYEEIVTEMAEAKRRIAESATDLPTLIDGWVRESYRFYDLNPAAFAYVYLSFPQLPLSDPAIATQNSRLFMAAFDRLDPTLARRMESEPTILAMAKSVMLSIPREIHEGLLEGPAIDHADEVVVATRSIILGSDPG